ncbi:MAG: response regulator, partial [Halohasta sp.]
MKLSERFLTQEDDRLTVETTTDPEAAVERIDADDYDAIISDYQMPGMTGIELLEHVRELSGPDLPFLLFTGEECEEVAIEALNLGADRYLLKDGDPARQYSALTDALLAEIEHANARTSLRENRATLQEYATAVEASDDSIYMLDPDGNYVFANGEHLSRLAADGKIARADESEVAGRAYVTIHAGVDAERLGGILEEVAESGEAKTEEYEFRTEDTWSYRTYSPVVDPHTDETLGVVVISKDITEHKRLAEREAFLSSLLRHDVKNKLHTADGYL